MNSNINMQATIKSNILLNKDISQDTCFTISSYLNLKELVELEGITKIWQSSIFEMHYDSNPHLLLSKHLEWNCMTSTDQRFVTHKIAVKSLINKELFWLARLFSEYLCGDVHIYTTATLCWQVHQNQLNPSGLIQKIKEIKEKTPSDWRASDNDLYAKALVKRGYKIQELECYAPWANKALQNRVAQSLVFQIDTNRLEELSQYLTNSHLAIAFAWKGNIEKAKTFANLAGFHKNKAYRACAETFSKQGDITNAKIFANLAGYWKNETYQNCAKSFAERGDVANVKAFADLAENYKNKAYRDCAKSFAERGDVANAKAFANLADSYKDEAYRDCAKSFAERGDVANAKAFADLAESYKGKACWDCAKSFAERGDVANAKAFADLAESYKGKAYWHCAKSFAERGDVANAKAFADLAENSKCYAYENCAEGFAKREDATNAKAFADLAEYRKKNAYRSCVEVFVEQGDLTNAKAFENPEESI